MHILNNNYTIIVQILNEYDISNKYVSDRIDTFAKI